ncbi:Putative MIOREX complex component 11 [Septoria linicola]|uniref:MIOREX complex component 11 n=1 Tax=Septoria linicola TaxID=215465 RepID=A0A9Q9EIV8_9PEZI|nr:putative MIOREX complex component 11 [Septoria linicola]USW51467.1 Putative MIOREX complex component 11 [Septoria linicola]
MNRLFRPLLAGRQGLRARARARPGHWQSRFASSKSSAPSIATTKETARVARIESRLPKFLRRYVEPLRNAPISHISAFLILHEITAVVPLFALTAAFHYTNWLPPFISEGKWVSDGIEKFGRYMRKKGWLSSETRVGRWFGRGETGTRIVVELATAYAVTKALLPFRLILSVWGTPWFATWTVLPITNRLARLFKSKKAATAAAPTPALGTGATAAGAVPKK